MRTISTEQSNVLAGVGRAEAVKVEIKDAGGTWRDVSSYPTFDALESVSWGENADDPHATADFAFFRDQDRLSLAPLMTASPINVNFTPGGSVSALLALNRQIRISVAVVGADVAPVAGDYFVVFHGRIDSIDPAGDTIQVSARDLGGEVADGFIESERVYAFAAVGGSPVGLRIWEPGGIFAVNDYGIPTDANRNGKFYKVTSITSGISATTEPAWPAAGTVVDGGVTWTYQSTTTLDTGYDVEDIIQNILDDAGLSSVVLHVPTTPGWAITQYKQAREPVLEAVRGLALQIGWECRFKWRSSSSAFELTLYEPDRDEAVGVQRTFASSEYASIEALRSEKNGIRNVVRVVYPDGTDKDPGGNPLRKTVQVTDATSITTYGRLFMEIAEGESSLIDSSAEATDLANACLKDLKDPVVTQAVKFRQGFPWAELGDRYTFSANGRHYDTNQTLALFEHRHEARDGHFETTLTCRGKPSGGFKRWHGISTRTRPEDRHDNFLFEAGNGVTLTAAETVGGVRLSTTLAPERRAHGEEFEYHVSTSSSFTPSSSTLKTVSRDRTVTVGDLIPGTTYYAKMVPRARNGMRIVRAQPSAQTSFVAGRAYAAHVSANWEAGRLPLNGGFETQFDSGAPPDHWSMLSGTWATHVTLQTGSGGVSGNTFLRFEAAAGQAQDMVSAYFNVEAGVGLACMLHYKNISGTGNWVIELELFDYAKSLNSTAGIKSIDVTTDVGTWKYVGLGNVSVGASDRYGRIRIRKATAANATSWAMDAVRVVPYDLPTQEDWVAPSLGSSWVDYGGALAGAGYYRASDGRVHLRGTIKDGTATPGTTLFTLPSGYRPPADVPFAVASNGAFGECYVDSSGNVKIQVGSNASFNLNGVSFRTT